MRILHIGKYYPPVRGGMENFLECLATCLSRCGTRNLVLVHEFQARRSAHSHSAASREDAENPGVLRVPILGKWLHTPVCPGFPAWLQKACRRFNPDIVHVQMPNVSGFWVLLISCLKTRAVVVHWQADVDDRDNGLMLRLFYRFYRPLEQALLRRAGCIIVSSRAYLEGSRALIRWRNKCRIIPLGIDPHRIASPAAVDRHRAAQLWGAAGQRVLAVGRLTFYKGMDHLILATRKLPDVRVVIAGTGSEQSKLEKLISMYGLHERVVLAGDCSDGLRSALLDTCTCFCLPSTGRAESFGIASLEAMAFSKPVIIGNVPGSGVGWVVENGVTGVHVEIASPDAISDAINLFASDPALARRMGEAGRRRLMKQFTIQSVVDQVIEIYTQLNTRAVSAK